MGNYEQLKNAIAEVIKTNGNQEITGQILQNVLKSIVSTLGANATFAGVATPTTNPGTPDGPVFYFALTKGNYINFNNIEIDNTVSMLEWKNGVWAKIDTGINNADIINAAIEEFNALFEQKKEELERIGGIDPEVEAKLNMTVPKLVSTSSGQYIGADGNIVTTPTAIEWSVSKYDISKYNKTVDITRKGRVDTNVHLYSILKDGVVVSVGSSALTEDNIDCSIGDTLNVQSQGQPITQPIFHVYADIDDAVLKSPLATIVVANSVNIGKNKDSINEINEKLRFDKPLEEILVARFINSNGEIAVASDTGWKVNKYNIADYNDQAKFTSSVRSIATLWAIYNGTELVSKGNIVSTSYYTDTVDCSIGDILYVQNVEEITYSSRYNNLDDAIEKIADKEYIVNEKNIYADIMSWKVGEDPTGKRYTGTITDNGITPASGTVRFVDYPLSVKQIFAKILADNTTTFRVESDSTTLATINFSTLKLTADNVEIDIPQSFVEDNTNEITLVVTFNNDKRYLMLYNNKTSEMVRIALKQKYIIFTNLLFGHITGTFTLIEWKVGTKTNLDVIFAGDSITKGELCNKTYAMDFLERTGLKVASWGVGGARLSLGVSCCSVMAKLSPKFILLNYGANGGNSIELFKQCQDYCDEHNVKFIVNHMSTTKSADADPSTTYIEQTAIIEEFIRDYAHIKSSARFDFATAINGNPNEGVNTSLMADGRVHPNDVGHERMCNRLFIDLPFFQEYINYENS